MAIGLGISRRDSWHVSEDISARISLEVAVTNGFSYLQCATIRKLAVSPGGITIEVCEITYTMGVGRSAKL